MADPIPAHHQDNWSAAGMVGMFDAVHRQRDRARYRRDLLLWCLTVAICLGVPLWITWGKFQDARRQTLLEEFAAHRPAAEQLTLANPAIGKALQQADTLRDAALKTNVAESIANLRQALQRLVEAQSIDRDLKRLRDLLDPLGVTLLETPWHDSSRIIAARVKALGQDQSRIGELLDLGDTPQAEADLAKLLKHVGELQRGNVEAMKTSVSRQQWLRLQASVPQRLVSNPAWNAIRGVGNDGEQEWELGGWTQAHTLYARAVERTEEFLESQLQPDEKAKLLQSDADALARLETEKADLQQKMNALHQHIAELGTQLAATNGERQLALQHVKDLTAERERLKESATAATTELQQLRPLKAQVKDTTQALQGAEKEMAALNAAKTTAEKSVQRLETQLAAKTAEVTALRTTAAGGGGDSAVVHASATLAAIDSQLATLDSLPDAAAAATRAREQLADALDVYDKAVTSKQQALAEKYLSTSQKVRGIEATIQQAEATLRAGLKRLDEPLASQYAELQGAITTAEQGYQTLLKEVAPDHRDAVQVKQRIDGLKAQQTRLAPARDRHSGKSTPAASELVLLCRGQVQELLVERRAAEFARLRASGKVPTAANLEMVPIAPGTFSMGSTGAGASSDEKPVHNVTISKPFYAGKYEVTVGQILTWLNSPGVTLKDEWIELDSSYCPVKKSGSKFELNTGNDFGKSRNQPMVTISWHGAKAFCDWCSQQDSKFKYRLPTEAEWEYMARAGSTTAYPWGDSCTSTQANISGGHGKTCNVGQYQPNAWGLYDSVGNVWEWCSDWYDSDYYTSSPSVDPRGPNSGSSVVVRSGSWYGSAVDARSSYRNRTRPTAATAAWVFVLWPSEFLPGYPRLWVL